MNDCYPPQSVLCLTNVESKGTSREPSSQTVCLKPQPIKHNTLPDHKHLSNILTKQAQRDVTHMFLEWKGDL